MQPGKYFFDYLIRPLPVRGKFRFLSPLLPSSGFRKASVWGYVMELNLADLPQRSAYIGSHEVEETGWCRNVLKSGDIAIDVGANCGWYSALFSRLVGNRGRVIALEPNIRLADRLAAVKAFNSIEQLEVVASGASDSAGSVRLYLPPSEMGNEDGTMSVVSEWDSFEVSVKTLDALCEERQIDEVCLVKMDIEGHEFKALKGASRLLREKRIKYLLLELNDYWLRQQGSSPQELMEFCADHGYVLTKGTIAAAGAMTSVFLQSQ